MGVLKSLVFLQAYDVNSGSCPSSSNAPKQSNFRWTRELTNESISSALSETFQIAPGQTQSLFSGVRTLSQDNTTNYSIALAPLQTNIYQLTYNSGTAPAFRTLRVIGTDATSQVTTSINGPILTYTFTGGTLPSLASVQPGDDVLIGSNFNLQNQGLTGIWQIISVTSNSFSVVNPTGIVEGPITLGSGFANQVRIFSAAGVQIGDTLAITGGFSPVSRNSYQVTLVTDYWLQFSYAGSLPSEGPINTEVTVYTMNKTMVYLESDQPVELLLNGAVSGPIVVPVVSNGVPFPGMFLLNSNIYSLSVINNSINQANITLLSAE
jgi:hypothetical protein